MICESPSRVLLTKQQLCSSRSLVWAIASLVHCLLRHLTFPLTWSLGGDSAPRGLQLAETRAEIEATFDSFPPHLLDSAKKLSGSALSGEDRVRRARKAGKWAKSVADGRCGSPNRTPQLDLRPRFYAVFRASRVSLPTLCRSTGTYWSIVGELSSSDSITHGFPSELESKIYFAGAGVSDYDSRQ